MTHTGSECLSNSPSVSWNNNIISNFIANLQIYGIMIDQLYPKKVIPPIDRVTLHLMVTNFLQQSFALILSRFFLNQGWFNTNSVISRMFNNSNRCLNYLYLQKFCQYLSNTNIAYSAENRSLNIHFCSKQFNISVT